MRNLRGSATLQIDSINREMKTTQDGYDRATVDTEIGEFPISSYVNKELLREFTSGEYNVEFHSNGLGATVIISAERA